MTLKKIKFWDVFWVVLILLILFTPVGFHARVLVSKILSFSPSVVEESAQEQLEDYSWRLQEFGGGQTDFKQFEDKIVVVNFWATWCPPCIAEMPSLHELYKSYGDRVEFVFLANDKVEKVADFLKKEAYDIPVYFSLNTPPALLSSSSIPATYVLDGEGKVLVKKIGAANWNSAKMHQLLDDLLSSR